MNNTICKTDGKKPKVAYNTLILPVAQGGLGLMDYPTRVKASHIQWVRRLLLDRVPNVATSLSSLIGCHDIRALLASKPGAPPSGILHNPFYLNLFKTWDSIHGFSPEGEDWIRREILWSNKRIISEDSPLANKGWETKGIHTINDICHPSEARLLSHQELADRYNVRCSFLDMLSLRLSVPLEWRRSLTANWSPTPDPTERSGVMIVLSGEQPMDVLNASPKQIYRAFISTLGHISTAFKRWQDHSDQNLKIANMEEWNDLSANIYKATRESKLQAFHFKIINCIIPCGTYLQQIKINQMDTCAVCGLRDTLPHFFYECTRNKNFWQAVFRWIGRVEDLRLEEIPPKHLILGLPQAAPKAKKINAILMSIKYYIHRQRLFHQGSLELLHWLRDFRAKLLVEREICTRENKLARFDQWKRILQAMG